MTKRKVPREIRICAAPDCNVTFERKITSPKKYCCSGHSGKGRKVIRRKLPRETRTCVALDCNATFECIVTSKRKYCIGGHANRGRKSPREIRTCAAPGCNNTFECTIASKRRFCIAGHGSIGLHPSKEHLEKNRKAQTGRHHSKKTKKKMRKSALGKVRSKEVKARESVARRGKNNPNYEKRRSKEWKEKQGERIRKLYQEGVRMGSLSPSLGVKPSGLENKLISFFKKYALDFRYCGNGTSIIGGKCPDFFHNLFKNKLIEVGNIDFYRVFRPVMTKQQYTQERTKHFEKHGFQTLVIWDEELRDEIKLLRRIEIFLGV